MAGHVLGHGATMGRSKKPILELLQRQDLGTHVTPRDGRTDEMLAHRRNFREQRCGDTQAGVGLGIPGGGTKTKGCIVVEKRKVL